MAKVKLNADSAHRLKIIAAVPTPLSPLGQRVLARVRTAAAA